MPRTLAIVSLLLFTTRVLGAEFADDFTDNAYTQAHWVFQSPFNCVNPAFTAAGTASGGNLCINSLTPGSVIGQATIAFAYETVPFNSNEVAVYTGVSFTAAELSGPARISKSVMLRFDPRVAPVLAGFGCPPSADGGDLYYVNMDPQSGGGNRFSIRKIVGGVESGIVNGPTYVWPANVHHNIYFAARWDPTALTNHLRAILYLNNILAPLVDLAADDASIKPDNLDPANNGNQYAGFVVSEEQKGPISGACVTVNTVNPCGEATSQFLVRDTVADLSLIDGDADGVRDACDVCANTTAGFPVSPFGCPPAFLGDFDGDGDVDSHDFDLFRDCATRSRIAVSDGCVVEDLDGDEDSDLDDFALFQACFAGADTLPPSACTLTYDRHPFNHQCDGIKNSWEYISGGQGDEAFLQNTGECRITLTEPVNNKSVEVAPGKSGGIKVPPGGSSFSRTCQSSEANKCKGWFTIKTSP